MPTRINWWWGLALGAFAAWLVRYWPVTELGRLDYRIYAGAVRSGDDLYRFRYEVLGLGFTYPPFAALLFWPLSNLSDDIGEQAWFLLNAGAMLAFLVLAVRALPARPNWPWLGPVCVGGGLFLMPYVLSARLGQVNALVALAVMLDLVGLRRGWRWAGAGVGLSTAVKLTPAVFIPYFWFSGRRRAAVVAAGTTVVAELVAYVLLPGPSRQYWGREYKATGRVGDLSSGYSNSIRRFVTWTDLPGGVQTLLWVALVGVLAVVAYQRAVAADRRGDLLAAFTIVSCFGYLASPITWGHHLWFLPVAVLLVLGDGRDRLRAVLAGGLLLTLLNHWDGGEGPVTSGLRFLALLLVVLALPSTAPQADPAGADRTDRRTPVPDR